MGDPLGSSCVSFQKQNREGMVGAQNGQYSATMESDPEYGGGLNWDSKTIIPIQNHRSSVEFLFTSRSCNGATHLVTTHITRVGDVIGGIVLNRSGCLILWHMISVRYYQTYVGDPNFNTDVSRVFNFSYQMIR
ncbi:hypothetical protein DVH24_017521 [Malus domestica]|uniref:Uncharacterized protein n=1 Tax=Malus domestica TaxID=3750 RepID=A0A498ISQ6_MALDO|nr:hypothetical protein DVH24_017521 [Malus domestica]